MKKVNNILAENEATKSELVDLVLWDKFKAGDRAAFASLYTRYFYVMFQYAKKITSDTDLIKDCIQEIFIELGANKGHISSTTSVRYYLFGSLRRRINKRLMKVSEKASRDLEFINQMDGFFNDSAENQIIEKELFIRKRESILKALEFLTKNQKQAVMLKFYDNKSNKEIANIMSIQTESVYNIISKAIGTLKVRLRNIYWIILLLFLFS